MTRLAIIFSLVLVTAWADSFLLSEKFSVGIKKDKDSREWRRAYFNKERFTIKWDEENLTLKGLIEDLFLNANLPPTRRVFIIVQMIKNHYYKFSPKYISFVHFNAFGSWIIDGFIGI